MRILLAIVGALLFSTPAVAQVPISTYVENRLDQLNTLAGSATTGVPLSPCPNVALEHHVIARLRDMFRNVDLSLREAELDVLERSACMAYDIYLIEEYIRTWIDNLIAFSVACEEAATSTMLTVLNGAVELLLDVRKGGLDPDYRRPGDAPTGATADDAKKTCPYTSDYAVPTFQDYFTYITPQKGKGCQLPVLPTSGPFGYDPLKKEVEMLDRLIQRFVSLTPSPTGEKSFLLSARKWRTMLNTLKNATWDYLTLSSPPHFLREPLAPAGYPFPLSPTSLFPTYGEAEDIAGEAGCRDWPSDLVPPGVVRGEGFPLTRRGFSPFALSGDPFLSQALARVSVFLKEAIVESPNEYLIMLRREMSGSYLPIEVLSQDTISLFREHMRREAALELSIGNFQEETRKASANLLWATKGLARLSLTLPDDPQPGDADYEPPVLRDVLRRFVTFMSQMCPNRGCTEPLERAFELSLRDECFPFTMINQYGTGANMIPPCGARYTPP